MNHRLTYALIQAKDLDMLLSIAQVVRSHSGNMRDSARALGVPERTFFRWCRLPQLAAYVDPIRQGRSECGRKDAERKFER